MSVPSTEVLTRASDGTPEYYLRHKEAISGEEYMELARSRFGIIAKVGAKCVGHCEDCDVPFSWLLEKVSGFTEVEPLKNDDKVVDKMFEVKTPICQKLNEAGVLDCRNTKHPTLKPKEQFIDEIEQSLYVQADVYNGTEILPGPTLS